MKQASYAVLIACAGAASAEQADRASQIAALSRDTDPRFDPDNPPEDYINFNQITVTDCLMRIDTLVYFPTGFAQHLLVSFDLNEATIDETDGKLYQFNQTFVNDELFSGTAQINFTAETTARYFRQDSPPPGYYYPNRKARIDAPDAIVYFRMEYKPEEQTVIELINAIQTYKSDYCAG